MESGLLRLFVLGYLMGVGGEIWRIESISFEWMLWRDR